MRFVCMSDTHGQHSFFNVPEGDVLIHAGDFCNRGTLDEVKQFALWLDAMPHKHKVIVAGNHDFPLEREPLKARALLKSFHYLQDEAITVDDLVIYGSPWQPFFNSWAFNLDRGQPLREKWKLIPDKVDILITHTPLYGVGDATILGERVGCEDLYQETIHRVKPKYHVCGHIHESRGIYQKEGVISINASCLNLGYRPYSEPIFTFDL